MNHDRAQRALAWLRQAHGPDARKVMRERFGFTDDQARSVTLGRASDETIAQLARKMSDAEAASFLLVTHGRRALPAMSPDKSMWFTPNDIRECPAGLEIFARDLLGLPPDDETDCTAYMLRNAGWVALSLIRGRAVVRCHAGARTSALERARDWLVERSDRIRTVEINGDAADSLAAIVELDRLARAAEASVAARTAGWRIERRPVESITAKHLQRFVVARHQAGTAPGTLPRVLQQTGVLPFAGLYHYASSGALRTLFQGAELGVDHVECIGREIGERSEKLYAENLRSRLVNTIAEPTFHRLRLPVNGWLWNYGSYATADKPAADGSRLLAVVVDIKSKEAA